MSDYMDRLRGRLCDELEPYVAQQKWSDTDLERIDRMTHAIKSIDTILAMGEAWDGDGEIEVEVERYGRRSRDGGDHGVNYRGNSHAGRRRDRLGRWSGRRGGMSRDGDIDDVMSQLEAAMRNSSDTNTRQDIQRIMQRLENA